MGLFGFFKKKRKAEPAVPQAYSGDQGFGELQPPFAEPLAPLGQLQPQPLDRPTSLSESDMHTVLSKLDLIAARLETLNERIANLEHGLRPPTTQQPAARQSNYQQAHQLPRW